MTVLVYGAGAVGLGIASCLARSGARVHLLARPAAVAALRERGLARTGIFGEHRVPPGELDVHTGLESVPHDALDYVLVATKSFDTEAAARDLARWHPNRSETRYVLFQNGWGNVEAFSAHLAPQRVFAARVITGFTRPALNEVRVTVHAEDIHIGSFQAGREEEVGPLAAAVARGGIPCSTTSSIARDLWAKMLYNCALNSLGAVFEVTYGELGACEESRRIMEAVVVEVYSAMHASGFQTHWSSPEEYLELFYDTLVPRTAAHESSTLQDIRAGKRTEIEALNGAVVRLAAAKGMPVPANLLLLDMVRFKERRNRGRPASP
jgi:2-dehydropantoate 2-reductase